MTTLRRFVPTSTSGSPTAGEFLHSQMDVQRCIDALVTNAQAATSTATKKTPTRKILTGSGTYTTPPNCALYVRAYGGGAGGGACAAQAVSTAAAASGGAAGGCAELYIAIPSASYAYVCGAGGAGGAAGANDGVVGGDTLFGVVVIAKGGTPGAHGISTTLGSAQPGGAGQAGGLGDVVGASEDGVPGYVIPGSSGIFCQGGPGGNSPVGVGGAGSSGFSYPGADASGYAAGGSGATSYDVTGGAKAGGKGTDGVIIVDEVYL